MCSAHYIREKIVELLALESMQRILWYVQSYEKLFAQRQLAEFGEMQKKELAENAKIKTEGLQRFIDKAKQVRRLEALTSELVHEFIEKIDVSAPEYKGGKRYQKVAIHYNGVGIIRESTPEEMEEYFQEHISKNLPWRQKRHSHWLHRLNATIIKLKIQKTHFSFRAVFHLNLMSSSFFSLDKLYIVNEGSYRNFFLFTAILSSRFPDVK